MFQRGDRLICIDDQNFPEWVFQSFSDMIKKDHQYICEKCSQISETEWIVNVRGIRPLDRTRRIGWKATRFIRIQFRNGKFEYYPAND